MHFLKGSQSLSYLSDVCPAVLRSFISTACVYASLFNPSHYLQGLRKDWDMCNINCHVPVMSLTSGPSYGPRVHVKHYFRRLLSVTVFLFCFKPMLAHPESQLQL